MAFLQMPFDAAIAVVQRDQRKESCMDNLEARLRRHGGGERPNSANERIITSAIVGQH